MRDAHGFVGWNKLYTWLQDGRGGGPLITKGEKFPELLQIIPKLIISK